MASVENIMEDAGKFCRVAADWGYDVKDVHTEKVDLPQRLKDAAAKAAAQKDEMKSYEIKQATRLAMIKKMKANMPELSDREALVAVDTLLDLSLKRQIFEVDVPALPELSKTLGPNAVRILQIFRGIVNKMSQAKEGA